MKKSCCFMKIVSALFALALFASCDTGGGGGGGGGGNSAQTSKTNITITIPSATSSSSDINLLGDFGIDDTKDFYYEIYFTKGAWESEHKEGSQGGTVNFSDVKYDTYTFYLKIWVDRYKNAELGTIPKVATVSASNNTVTFPDMSTSTYKNWYFVKNVDDLTRALSKIAEDSSYNESNKAILCLLATIEYPGADSVKNNNKIKIIENGYSFAAHLYTVTLPSDLPAGCSVTTNNADNKFAENVTVTLTVTAADGWLFFPPTKDGVPIPRSEGAPTQFTFNMPADDVEVTTTFFDAIYVSASGNSANDGLSEATAVDSLASAINKINAIGSELSLESFDWTIKVCGTIRGAQTFAESQLYGTASVTIVGETGGTIDGNNSDSALTINVTVPVTIKNLTIKNGAGSTDTGGGITISENSTVTIEDGVSIESNTSEQYGGGIHNKGTLTINGGEIKNNTADYYGGGIFNDRGGNIYICGSTVITGNSCSTTLKYGGGIYNSPTGTIYLGYKSQTEKEAWTGSITGNSAVLGGGIWNGATAVLYFDSGTISSNTTTSSTSSDSVELMGNTNNAPALYLSGSATITGGDKIYLSPYGSGNKLATISVDEDITNTVSVTMGAQYTAGTQVLTGSVSAVGTSYTNFSLTNTGLYKIGSEGKLVAKDVDKFTLADFNALTFQNDAIPTKTFNNNADILNKVIVYKPITALDTYMVMKVTDLNSTSQFSGTAVLYNTLTGTKQPFTITNQSYINLITGGTDDGFVTTTASYFATESSGGVTFYNTEYSILE